MTTSAPIDPMARRRGGAQALVRRPSHLHTCARAHVPRCVGPHSLIWMLAHAADRRLPPFERARLLAVFSQHLDGVLACDGIAGESARWLPDGLVRVLSVERDRILHDEVLPALAAQGVAILPWSESTSAERAWLRTLFRKSIYPLLTPLAVDSTHPFPCIPAGSVYVAALVRDREGTRDRFACVPVRHHLFGFGPFDHGFVRLDAERLIGVDVVISTLLDDLFHGMQVVEKSTFRVVAAPLPRADEVTGRPFPRLEVDGATSAGLGELIRHNLAVADEAVYRMRAPLGLVDRIAAIRTTPGSGRS